MERHMDRIACVLGLSPVEIRRGNFLQPEQHTTTEQTVKEKINLNHLLDRALELSGYESKRARFAIENESAATKKGMGIAAFLHGAGFTGSGERYLGSVVGIEAHADGRVRVRVWSAEFATGTNTVLCQTAAETLGPPYEDIESAQPDRREGPNNGLTVASRTARI